MRFKPSQMLFACAYFAQAIPLAAQTIPQRDSLQQTWSDKQKEHHNLYETTPVTHIVPDFNTITYSVRGEKIDANVSPEEPSYGRNDNLKLTGYTVAPHMAVSLKHIGLGFSAEGGQRRAVYTSTGTSRYERQESYLDYRGLGLYIYWIAPSPFQIMTPSVTLGNSSYAVKHNASLLKTSSSSAPDDNSDSLKNFTYTVAHYEVGLNLGMKLLKDFTFTPWAHYDVYDTKDGTKQVDTANSNHDQNHAVILEKDLDLFWHSANKVKYGLDLSVRMFDRVEVHLGGLIGLVMASGYNTASVTDKSVSLGVSFDQKGN